MASALHKRPSMMMQTFESISTINLETVIGGAAAATNTRTKPAAPITTTQQQSNIPGDLISGCLTGAGGGIMGGVHGAALGCAVGAGQALLKDLGSSFGINLGASSK
jgi:hypothetical protein